VSDGELFGAFATPARSFAKSTDGALHVDDDDDDGDDDDDFGDFATPATTMKTIVTPPTHDETPKMPLPTRTTTGDGEFDLIALTNDGEFTETVRRLLKRGKSRSTKDDAEKETFGRLDTGVASGGGRFTSEAFDQFQENVKREREARTETSESEEDEETFVDDATPREIMAEFDLISLESAPKIAETTSSTDPFAKFGDIALESPAPPQNAVINDDEFGDFV